MPETSADFNHNQPIYSVSEISQTLKRVVEDHFGVVRLRGEISGFKLHSSGHGYFSLKDDQAVIDAVCFRGSISKLRFKPEDGLEIIATGRITTYPGRSKYQIVIEHMEPAGVGALMALLEKRRKMLELEGLFAESRKRKLPYMPRVIGVITSPTGAVIRDILHRIEERFGVHVIVWPVAVQGEGAAEQIASAINGFNAFNALDPKSQIPIPDLLIVARGGGSIEDLWAFNEEIVVRATANSRIPLISAVGHETDTTLIDHASDKRAPTPTAAAEIAVPVREELRLSLTQLELRYRQGIRRLLTQRTEQLDALSRGLPRPAQLLQMAAQRFDDWSERLSVSLPAHLARKEQQLALLTASLRPQALQRELALGLQRLDELAERLQHAWARNEKQKTERLSHLTALLESMNYTHILKRGFALVRGDGGTLITSAASAAKAKSLTLIFADGEVKRG